MSNEDLTIFVGIRMPVPMKEQLDAIVESRSQYARVPFSHVVIEAVGRGIEAMASETPQE